MVIRKIIVCFLVIVLLTGCTDFLRDFSNEKQKESLDFHNLINVIVPNKPIFDPYDVILLYDPVSMIKKTRSTKYAIIKNSNETFSRDKSLAFISWEGIGGRFTVIDFKEFTISIRQYGEWFDYYYEEEITDYYNKEVYPIEREDPYDLLALYDMRTNIYNDYESGCTLNFEEKTYSPETENCHEEFIREIDGMRLDCLEHMLIPIIPHFGEYKMALNKALSRDRYLVHQYYEKIIEYVEKHYDFSGDIKRLDFSEFIYLIAPTENIFKPYDVVLLHDPIFMLVQKNDRQYASEKHSDGSVSVDKSLILEAWKGKAKYYTVFDFENFTISTRIYDLPMEESLEKELNSEYVDLDISPISRENSYELLNIYDIKTDTYEDIENGCTIKLGEYPPFSESEECLKIREYINVNKKLYLQDMLTSSEKDGDYHTALRKILIVDDKLVNQYYEKIIEYVGKHYDFTSVNNK